MDDQPDLIEDTPRMRRVLERESGTPTDDRREDDSLPDSITRNIRRGVTPDQLEQEGRSE